MWKGKTRENREGEKRRGEKYGKGKQCRRGKEKGEDRENVEREVMGPKGRRKGGRKKWEKGRKCGRGKEERGGKEGWEGKWRKK
jgi:hypothetical protein